MNTIPISRDAVEQALKELISAYVRLLQSGKDRIESLGGQCDPVDVMERSDPYLKKARAVLAQADQPAVPQTQAVEPSPIAYGFESRGKIMDVITPEEHDREPGRYNVPLITLQSHREAIKVIHDEWELDVRQHREVIAKKDAEIAALELEAKTGAEFYVAERDKKDAEAAELRAALVRCVETLEEAKSYTSSESWSPSMTEEIDAAITQAQEVLK